MNKITVKPTIIKPLISIKSETKKPSKMNNFLDVYYKLKITPEFYSSVIKGI